MNQLDKQPLQKQKQYEGNDMIENLQNALIDVLNPEFNQDAQIRVFQTVFDWFCRIEAWILGRENESDQV